MTWAKVRHLTDWVTQASLVYLFFERDSKHVSNRVWGRGREQGIQRIPSRLHTVNARGHFELTKYEIINWAEIKHLGCLTNWATQAPLKPFFKKWYSSNINLHSQPKMCVRVSAVLLHLHPGLEKTVYNNKITYFSLSTIYNEVPKMRQSQVK